MRPVVELLDADGVTVGYAEIYGADTGNPSARWDAAAEVTVTHLALTPPDGERFVVPVVVPKEMYSGDKLIVYLDMS